MTMRVMETATINRIPPKTEARIIIGVISTHKTTYISNIFYPV